MPKIADLSTAPSAQANSRTRFRRPSTAIQLDAADLNLIAEMFSFGVGLVLAAAMAGDAYLVALLRATPATADDFMHRQLAADLLPWALAFTAVVLAGIVTAHRLKRLLASDARSSGFGTATLHGAG